MKYWEIETSNNIFKRRNFKKILQKKEEEGLCEMLDFYSDNHNRYYIIESENIDRLKLNGEVSDLNIIDKLGISGVVLLNSRYVKDFKRYVNNSFSNPSLKENEDYNNPQRYVKFSFSGKPEDVSLFHQLICEDENAIFVDYRMRAEEYQTKVQGMEKPKD